MEDVKQVIEVYLNRNIKGTIESIDNEKVAEIFDIEKIESIIKKLKKIKKYRRK